MIISLSGKTSPTKHKPNTMNPANYFVKQNKTEKDDGLTGTETLNYLNKILQNIVVKSDNYTL